MAKAKKQGGAGKFEVTILRESCKGLDDCGICRQVCPAKLFTACRQMNRAGYLPPKIADEKACSGCQNCMIHCPDFAVVVEERQSK